MDKVETTRRVVYFVRSWEGLVAGSFPRFHEDKDREISVNISRITDLLTPKSFDGSHDEVPSQGGGLSNLKKM
jgi:hypothetical protein